MAGLATSFGSAAMTNPISDIDQAGCLLVIGSNTTETHPIIGQRLKRAARFGGAKLIVANPKRIELCEVAEVWLRHRPGTDVALLNGLAHVILAEGLWDREYVLERTEGFDAWRRSVEEYTPKLVSQITGVDAEDLVRAARMFARPAFGGASILYTLGITLHRTGTDNVAAVANLAMLTGNVGKPGAGVNPLRGQSNVQGACDMGCLPDFLPGYQRVADERARARLEEAWGLSLPSAPGLTEPDMMAAIGSGEIAAMYIMGENPAVSDADANHVRKALRSLGFLVVQDIFLTETAQMADVVLPAASFAEKEGTFTNTERRVQRVRKAVPPPAEARPDWWIISEIAKRVQRRLGQSEVGFAFSEPRQIALEIARVTPSYRGITYERLENNSLQWPCPDEAHPGTPRLHVGQFSRGRGRFVPVGHVPPAEEPDEDYPLLLTTGRSLYHYHTGSLTRRVAGLSEIAPAAVVEVNPVDAGRYRLTDGDWVRVVSRRGAVETQVQVVDKVPRGVVFMTFHFAEVLTNALTSASLDPTAKAPELKVCAVRVEKLNR